MKVFVYIVSLLGLILSLGCTPQAKVNPQANTKDSQVVSGKASVKVKKMILDYEARLQRLCSSIEVLARRIVSGKNTKFIYDAYVYPENYRAKFEEWKIKSCNEEKYYEVRYVFTYHKTKISIHPKNERIPELILVEHIAKNNECYKFDKPTKIKSSASHSIYQVSCHLPDKLMVIECEKLGCSLKNH